MRVNAVICLHCSADNVELEMMPLLELGEEIGGISGEGRRWHPGPWKSCIVAQLWSAGDDGARSSPVVMAALELNEIP